MKQFPMFFMFWPWVVGIAYHLLDNDTSSATVLIGACILFWIIVAPLMLVAFRKS